MRYENVIKCMVASFDVDPQNCFTPNCPDELPVVDGDKIVDELLENHKLSSFKVASKEWHHPEALHIATEENPQFSPVLGNHLNMDIYWNRHGTAGTYGAEFLEGLPEPEEYDFVSYKGLERNSHPYGGAFHDFAELKSTGVIEHLKLKVVKYIILGGLATDYCVKATGLQLARAGFTVFLNLAACRGIDKETTEKAIKEMKDNNIVVCENAKDVKVKIEDWYTSYFYPQDI